MKSLILQYFPLPMSVDQILMVVSNSIATVVVLEVAI